MSNTTCFLTGVGVGCGVMFLLDPQTGRRRRALTRDKMVRLGHRAEDAAGVVARDMSNRARGLASGDLSVLAGGRRALNNPFRGSWSPTARALMTLGGTGLFLYGLTQQAPTACVLGTAGLGLIAEGLTNAGMDDITRLPEKAANSIGLANSMRSPQPESVGAGA